MPPRSRGTRAGTAGRTAKTSTHGQRRSSSATGTDRTTTPATPSAIAACACGRDLGTEECAPAPTRTSPATRRRAGVAASSIATRHVNQQIVAPKLRWLQHHEPEVVARIATIFGSYDYITYRLTGARSVDHNWALKSGLMDIRRREFSAELLAEAGIEPGLLPPIRASHEVVGRVTAEAAAATGLAAGTPVVAGCADHVASAFVAGASHEGDLVLKFGGAGDILLSTGKPVTDPRLFIDYHIVPGPYFSNGCTAASGSLLNWIVRELAGGEQAAASAAGLSDPCLARPPGERRSGRDPRGWCCCPISSARRRRCTIRMPAAPSSASACITASPISGGRRWRASIFGFRHHVEVFARARPRHDARVFACDGGAASDLWLQIAADVHRPAGAAHRPASRLLPGRRLCRRPWRGAAARFRRHFALCRPVAGSSSRSPPIARL